MVRKHDNLQLIFRIKQDFLLSALILLYQRVAEIDVKKPENIEVKKHIIIQDLFRIPKFLFGALFIIGGSAVGILFEKVEAFMMIPIGIALFAHSAGLELDFENQKYQQYTSLFGKKKGEWRSLASYTALIILRKDGKTNLSTTRATISSTLRYHEYQVFLTDQSHRKRLYLKHFDTADQAKKYTSDFMEKTGIPLERFNPVISEETRNRR
jgi:hypothetical protein